MGGHQGILSRKAIPCRQPRQAPDPPPARIRRTACCASSGPGARRSSGRFRGPLAGPDGAATGVDGAGDRLAVGAASHLEERQSVFAASELETLALQHSPGRHSIEAVREAIGLLVRDAHLVEATLRHANRAYVTDRALKGPEMRVRPIHHREERRVRAHLFIFTSACWRATWSGTCAAPGRRCCTTTKRWPRRGAHGTPWPRPNRRRRRSERRPRDAPTKASRCTASPRCSGDALPQHLPDGGRSRRAGVHPGHAAHCHPASRRPADRNVPGTGNRPNSKIPDRSNNCSISAEGTSG